MSGPIGDLFASDPSNDDDVRPASTIEGDGEDDGMDAAAVGPDAPTDDWLEPQSGGEDAGGF